MKEVLGESLSMGYHTTELTSLSKSIKSHPQILIWFQLKNQWDYTGSLRYMFIKLTVCQLAE